MLLAVQKCKSIDDWIGFKLPSNLCKVVLQAMESLGMRLVIEY